MKKFVLSGVIIGSLIALSGCAEPGAKERVYTASQEAYECGTKTVVIDHHPETKQGFKELKKRDDLGFIATKKTKTKVLGTITIYDWPADPYSTYWLRDESFNMPRPADTAGRARADETWSFRKQSNGKYYFGFVKNPDTRKFLDGHWCKRIH
jgi:hypothetical protein